MKLSGLNNTIIVFGIYLMYLLGHHAAIAQSKEFSQRLEEAYVLRYQDPDSAANILQGLVAEAEDNGDVPNILLSRNNLAMAYKEMARLGDATRLVFSNLSLIDSLGISHSGNTYLVAGHVTAMSGDLEEARVYYDQAIEKFLEHDDDEGLAYAYAGKGILYYDQADYNNALRYYLLAELHWKNSEDPLYADLMNNIGAVYIEFGQYKKALFYYKKTYQIYVDLDWLTDQSLVEYNMGELFLEMESYDSSFQYYNKSLETAKKAESAIDESWAYEGLYQYHKSQDNIAQALFYYEKHIQMRDSIQSSQDLTAALSYKARYESSLKDKKILEQEVRLRREISKNANAEFERREREKEKEQSRKEKIMLWISIALIAGVGVVVFLMYSRIKKVNQELRLQKNRVESKNELIDKSLREKEILLKEIHHRVKNNLQIISSLLNLQSHRIDDQKVIETLAVSRDRIQAIALVHQKLYQSKDLSRVDFKAYMHDLLEQQKSAYSSVSSRLSVEINAIELRLLLDDAVPLGIILSELVTNAFKHGLSQISEPQLNIDLYENGHQYYLKVRDNGPGLPEDFSFQNSESLGMEIIQALITQIDGTLEHENDNGAIFLIKFNHQL